MKILLLREIRTELNKQISIEDQNLIASQRQIRRNIIEPAIAEFKEQTVTQEPPLATTPRDNQLITTFIHTSHKIVSQRDNIAREKAISTLSCIVDIQILNSSSICNYQF